MSIAADRLGKLASAAREKFNARPKRQFDLAYSPARDILWGQIGKWHKSVKAYSGGGEGALDKKNISTAIGADSPFKAASYRSKKDITTENRGGSIPPGPWFVAPVGVYKSDNFQLPYALLVPIGFQSLAYWTRDYHLRPFLIHGRGKLGSDGCIVIGGSERADLLNAVTQAGGAFLYVIGDGGHLLVPPSSTSRTEAYA